MLVRHGTTVDWRPQFADPWYHSPNTGHQQSCLFLCVTVAVIKIKDDVVAGKRPATRLFLEDVPDYVKEITSQCWAQEPDDRPTFSGTAISPCLLYLTAK